MKKNFYLIFIPCFLFSGFVNAQQLYSNFTTIKGSIVGADLGTNQILFDDVEIPDGLVLAEDSINITQVKISVDRENQEADTYTLYYTTLDESGTGSPSDPSYFTRPPVSIGIVTVPSTAATSQNNYVITFGDSVNTLFKIKTPTLEILSGQKTFFIGLGYSSSVKNGWNYTDGSQSSNIVNTGAGGGLWLFTPPATLDTASIFDGFGDYATMAIQVFGTLGSLPVNFINFDGLLQNNIAVLNWSTSAEYNNKGFEVEKSTDGQSYTDIGFVAGNGTTKNISNYTFSDPKMLSGDNYYRLKQIDLDGNYKYSSVIKLEFSKLDWTIIGNPSNNSSVQLQLDKQHTVVLQIVSLAGNVIQTINKGTLEQGTYSIPLDLSHAASEMYVVRMIIDGQSSFKNIVK